MTSDEAKIIKKAKSGNRSATTELYRRYERYWFRLCLRYGRDRMEAQDIFQEGMAKVFKGLNQFKPEKGSFATWSSRVIVNEALKYLKRHRQLLSFEEWGHGEEPYTEPTVMPPGIDAKQLTQIIQQLPSGYRMIFNMYELEGYTHKEIAQVLGISQGTSKSQLSKAKRMLRDKLKVLF